MERQDFWALGAFFFLCAVIAVMGGAVTAPNVAEWYAGLNHPSFRPPDSLFAPVWTVLYILIAVSGWLVWRRVGFDPALPMLLYGIQLALNFAWSLIFFGGHRIGLALIDIVLLLVVIVLTIVSFWRIAKIAALLLVPYLLWVSFATALNAAVWRLN